MKNLHLIPTDKPSKLFKDDFGKYFISINIDQEQNHFKPQHIYITSDEQAKEGDWGYIPFEGGNVKLVGKYFADDWKKIILTTDQDLIKDGVQAIDDEFIKWFVENPSCEWVKVEDYPILKSIFDGPNDVEIGWEKKIIIPKQEPKQETIEEAARRYTESTPDNNPVRIFSFIEGAKWQAERMYSDMEEYSAFVLKSYKEGLPLLLAKEWFEQFKNQEMITMNT